MNEFNPFNILQDGDIIIPFRDKETKAQKSEKLLKIPQLLSRGT